MVTHDEITEWVFATLAHHDPIGAWDSPSGDLADCYAWAAQELAGRLPNILGVGHIYTLIADSIDQKLPGFYRAASAGEDEIHRRVSQAARELWDGRYTRLGIRLGQASARPAIEERLPTIPSPPSVQELIANGACISGWLRAVENGLWGEPNPFSDPGRWTLALREALPTIVDAYSAAVDAERAAMRLSFSRFRRVLHGVSRLLAGEFAAMASPDSDVALRRGLMAESLLDMGTDWRDELMVLRDARSRAVALGLPFDERVEEAAAASSTATARFLRGLLGESG